MTTAYGRMITAITDSLDLAVILNLAPATEADAAETPRDWLAGIWVAGTVYPLDADATTDTRAVLADGTAAVEYSLEGSRCHGQHRIARDYTRAHWCAADADHWTAEDDARGVVRDWRSVRVWDANGYSEATVHDTLEQARAAFDSERADLERITAQMAEEDPYAEDDEL